MSVPPIGPYVRLPAVVLPWDPRFLDVAATVRTLVGERRPDLVIEHIGSSAVPGLPGKGIVDLSIATTKADVPVVAALLRELGFGPQPGPDPWPPSRPMLVGSLAVDDATFRIHCHVLPDAEELRRDIAFRDALLADPSLVEAYAALKSTIVEGSLREPHQYTYQKQAWIADVHRRLGVERPPIVPPATIGILGGGQLGRMLALAARAMGYRIVVQDPDPACPAAAVADRMVVAGYDDVGAAIRLASWSDVVTYELEHVAVAVDRRRRCHRRRAPRSAPAAGDPGPDRRARVRRGDRAPRSRPGARSGRRPSCTRPPPTSGCPSASRWPPAGTTAADSSGSPTPPTSMPRSGGSGGQPGRPCWPRRELAFERELSIVVARGLVGRFAAFPVAQNRHDDGILVESVAPAPIAAEIAERAILLGERLAVAMGITGTLTAELFLMPDGRLVVNELAPRVHNSGHWTIEGAATSQFEQHIRAICGLDLGATDALAPTAMVNLLGVGPARAARLEADGLARAMVDPGVHLHVYDKRTVFERRKMGHLTAIGATTDDALERARTGLAHLHWQVDGAKTEVDA